MIYLSIQFSFIIYITLFQIESHQLWLCSYQWNNGEIVWFLTFSCILLYKHNVINLNIYSYFLTVTNVPHFSIVINLTLAGVYQRFCSKDTTPSQILSLCLLQTAKDSLAIGYVCDHWPSIDSLAMCVTSRLHNLMAALIWCFSQFLFNLPHSCYINFIKPPYIFSRESDSTIVNVRLSVSLSIF